MSEPRTKAGADLTREWMTDDPEYPQVGVPTDFRGEFVRSVRAIEDEMLDKVVAAVEGTRGQLCARGFTSVPHVRRKDVLAAIERIRRDDDA